MKKAYIIPVVEIEFMESDNLMVASPGTPQYSLGNGTGEDNRDGEGIDEFEGGESLSKGMGSFAFADDFEYSIDM